jgi:hypothetical protein
MTNEVHYLQNLLKVVTSLSPRNNIQIAIDIHETESLRKVLFVTRYKEQTETFYVDVIDCSIKFIVDVCDLSISQMARLRKITRAEELERNNLDKVQFLKNITWKNSKSTLKKSE